MVDLHQFQVKFYTMHPIDWTPAAGAAGSDGPRQEAQTMAFVRAEILEMWAIALYGLIFTRPMVVIARAMVYAPDKTRKY